MCIALPLCARVDLVWVDDIDEVMREASTNLRRDLVGTDIHITVDLTRVCADHLNRETVTELEG